MEKILGDGKTINDVLNNNELVTKLMNSKEAVDYMVKNEEIINKVANHSDAIATLGDSKYASYQVIMNEESKNAILNSPYSTVFDEKATKVPILTMQDDNIIASSYSTNENNYAYYAFNDSTKGWIPAYGEQIADSYIGYNFNKDVICYKVEINFGTWNGPGEQEMVLQVSDDNVSYENVTQPFKLQLNEHSYDLNKLISGQYIRLKGVSGAGIYVSPYWNDCILRIQFYCVDKI